MERMLVMLEARFRKMLEAQNFVYEETVSLEKSRPNVPEHEVEIASATLSRKEDQIVRHRVVIVDDMMAMGVHTGQN